MHGKNKSIKISNTRDAKIMHWATYIGGHIPQDTHQKGSLVEDKLLSLCSFFVNGMYIILDS
jgi:hypothetical protein